MKSLIFYALIASQLAYFHTHYNLHPSDGGIVAFGHYIRDHTRPDDVILVYGMEWSPILVYYTERKAVMFPASLMTEHDIADATKWAETLQIGAVVRCDPRCEVKFR